MLVPGPSGRLKALCHQQQPADETTLKMHPCHIPLGMSIMSCQPSDFKLRICSAIWELMWSHPLFQTQEALKNQWPNICLVQYPQFPSSLDVYIRIVFPDDPWWLSCNYIPVMPYWFTQQLWNAVQVQWYKDLITKFKEQNQIYYCNVYQQGHWW